MQRAAIQRRVAITGLGVAAPGGMGTKNFWSQIVDGRTATRTISLFDAAPFRSRVAAECDFDAIAEGLTPQEIRRMDRAAQLAVVTLREAITDSGLELDRLDPRRIGVSVGSAVGCSTSLEEEYVVVSNGGQQWLVDYRYAVQHLYEQFIPSSLASEVAWAAGARWAAPACPRRRPTC